MVLGDLDKLMRKKTMYLITMDSHSRDIIGKLMNKKVCPLNEFQWKSQLKAYFDTPKNDFKIKIADVDFWYGYEYLENGQRLYR
jgi:hypothetical protein